MNRYNNSGLEHMTEEELRAYEEWLATELNSNYDD